MAHPMNNVTLIWLCNEMSDIFDKFWCHIYALHLLHDFDSISVNRGTNLSILVLNIYRVSHQDYHLETPSN